MVTHQVDLSTSYKSKKIQNLKFGDFYSIDECLVSINETDCIVMIDLKTNRLLTYESL